jgi:hypothetical protein
MYFSDNSIKYADWIAIHSSSFVNKKINIQELMNKSYVESTSLRFYVVCYPQPDNTCSHACVVYMWYGIFLPCLVKEYSRNMISCTANGNFKM